MFSPSSSTRDAQDDIQQLIQATRLHLQLRQRDFGRLIGLSQGRVSSLERGTSSPSGAVLWKIQQLAWEIWCPHCNERAFPRPPQPGASPALAPPGP